MRCTSPIRWLFWLGAWGMVLPAAWGQWVPRADGRQAMEHLERQVALGPRVPGTDSHRRALDYFLSVLKPLANEVSVQRFVHRSGGQEVPMANLIARFGDGGAPVLLCAHWDTRPRADQEKDPQRAVRPIPGANDGASGVAVLLEVARHLAQTPPPVPVWIVLFDGEDWGETPAEMFLGSRHFAQTLPAEGRPRYGILLDMVGDADLRIPIEPHSYQAAPELIERIWRTAEALGVRAFVREFGPPVLDDHLPLIAAGVPTVNLIDFDYPYWHTLEDTPERCSPESLEAVGNVVLSFLYGLSE
ncbi:MAG: hypothetical protein KatS3mg115_2587 [Candidatus Poribacteria bacterium]|nr:MAG: hypothetical protein KatS3mg115_2587 [Candidatus Poribacteria bacterium]